MMETAVAAEKSYAPEPAGLPGAPAWLAELRRAAFARFTTLGFPTPKNEDWRYTGVQPISDTPWTPARRDARVSRLPEGARLASLSDAEAHLARIALLEHSAFAALNTASFQDALVLEILPGAVISEPIEILFDSAADRPEVAHPRLLVLAGERSQARVVERYTGAGRYFTNAVTEIAVGPAAVIEHTKLQQESLSACHVQTLAVRQERSSRFTSHNFAFGSALARTDIHVDLAGEGAECSLNGLFAGRGRQHLDNHTVIDHAKPHCASRELYKGIMDGASRGVFHGKVIVRPDAQKTDAVQTNKNLLLSREALVNSTPALEILADDVKCKHGSTTGQLDAAALFYLRSRGIGEDAARALLTWAFAAEVAERIGIPSVREAVERELGVLLSAAAPEGPR
jgi:Fe-S cluster assembly protein SufD